MAELAFVGHISDVRGTDDGSGTVILRMPILYVDSDGRVIQEYVEATIGSTDAVGQIDDAVNDAVIAAAPSGFTIVAGDIVRR